MEEIRRLGKLCDITLVASDHKFTAHRIVLASNIPYFKGMFLNDMIESKQEVITINTIDPGALEQFINYSYNGKIIINNENVQSLLIGANFFHLKNIKNACCEFIKKRLSIQDALCVRNFAEQLMCPDLVLAVNRFINKNFNRIISTSEFLDLTSKELADLLSRDELNVESEEQVYEAFTSWLKHDEANRKEHLPELFKLVRLPLISPIFIIEKISKEPLIKNDLKARDILDEGTHYHMVKEKRSEFKSFNLKPRCCNDAFGLIYAIGGLNSTGGHVSTVEVYDCISNKWRLAESMMTNRSRVAVAVLQGRLYAIGGYNGLERLHTVEVFEPETKKWKKVSSISKSRSALGSAVLNNKLYVCGGFDGFQSSDTVEMYDPKTDTYNFVFLKYTLTKKNLNKAKI
jgi:kelch-like protein 18